MRDAPADRPVQAAGRRVAGSGAAEDLAHRRAERVLGGADRGAERLRGRADRGAVGLARGAQLGLDAGDRRAVRGARVGARLRAAIGAAGPGCAAVRTWASSGVTAAR